MTAADTGAVPARRRPRRRWSAIPVRTSPGKATEAPGSPPASPMWFGIGDASKIALISISAGIPIYVNRFTAIRGVDARLVEMAAAAGASRWRLITRVLLPGHCTARWSASG